MAFKLLLFITLLPVFAFAASESVNPTRNYISVLSDLWRIFAVNQRCFSRGFFECLRLRFFRAIDVAVKTTDILEVTSGVHFVRNPDVAPYNGTDPRALADAQTSVGSFLAEKLQEFLRTHLLQISFPMGRSSGRVGGKKMKIKIGGKGGAGFFFALAVSIILSATVNIVLMMGTVVMPVVVGGIALIAIVVAKIAFVLVGVAGVKTLMEDDTPKKVKIIAKEMQPDYDEWGKQLQAKESSHNLAYSSYVPEVVMQSGFQPMYQH